MSAVATSSSTVNGGNIIATGKTISPTGPHAVVGDLVAPHPPYTGAHNSAVMVQGSTLVSIDGKPVCREGDLASCGHTVDAGTGYQPVQIVR